MSHKDYFGKTIDINDIVVFSSRGTKFRIEKVLDFTPKKLKTSPLDEAGNPTIRSGQATSCDTVMVLNKAKPVADIIAENKSLKADVSFFQSEVFTLRDILSMS